MVQALETFKLMLEMQKLLLSEYIKIEGLPNYPVDLDSREGQKVVKRFMGRFIDELSEAYMEIYYAHESISMNFHPQAQERIINYNIEIADSTHFLLEILLYSDIDQDVLDTIISDYLNNNLGLYSMYKPGDTLGNLLRMGNFYNYHENLWEYNRNCFIINDVPYTTEFPEYSGGHKISPPLLTVHAKLLWELTCNACMVTNQLKNREWKKTEKTIDKIVFYEKILNMMIAWARYLDLAGFTNQGLFKIYSIKNQLNHERISKGY